MKIKALSRQLLVAVFLSVALLCPISCPVQAQNCDEKYDCSNYNKTEQTEDYNNCIVKQKGCWEAKISEAQSEANTLQSTIS
ncbi:hypothetical protein EOM81_12515, partial [bacterium]|nr:hypothetical protein [bacterium]